MLQITEESHVDHGLTPEHIEWLLATFADKTGFFISTVEMPAHLAPTSCGLFGPIMGDAPILESEVTYVIRGNRKCATRALEGRLVRETRLLTVVMGPSKDGPCVLYTSYGGPNAPREPGDTTIPIDEIQASRDFWKDHALAV